jgi:hypothetical protein
MRWSFPCFLPYNVSLICANEMINREPCLCLETVQLSRSQRRNFSCNMNRKIIYKLTQGRCRFNIPKAKLHYNILFYLFFCLNKQELPKFKSFHNATFISALTTVAYSVICQNSLLNKPSGCWHIHKYGFFYMWLSFPGNRLDGDYSHIMKAGCLQNTILRFSPFTIDMKLNNNRFIKKMFHVPSVLAWVDVHNMRQPQGTARGSTVRGDTPRKCVLCAIYTDDARQALSILWDTFHRRIFAFLPR